MKSARHLERDGYHAFDWRDDSGFSLADLWGRFPDLVTGRYLVNTSYDSGFLTLSESDIRDGWRMIGALAHSPLIREVKRIPHDQYDEWLVFEQPTEVKQFVTMVHYTGFTPLELAWEEEQFWSQIIQLRPLHVLGENDGVYLVSRDLDLVREILRESK